MDLERLKKLAGVQLNEDFRDNDDDDGLTPAERALAKKADTDLAKKGIKVKDVDPDKDLESMAKSEQAKKEAKVAKKEEKQEPKVEPKKEEPKAEEKAAEEAKKRGRAAGEKHAAMSKFMADNKGVSRKDFIAHAKEKHGMSQHHANTMYYSMKKKLNEFYVVNNYYNGRVLAEWSSYDRPYWVLFENQWARDAMIFDTEESAQEAVEKMNACGIRTIAVVKHKAPSEE
jgi:hypothetical protein